MVVWSFSMLKQKVVDRRVLTADVDAGLGHITCVKR